ncbi:MAG: ABC transporter permease, partial [Longimicrobiales bacterium]
VLVRPLPYAESDQVVILYNSYPNAGAPRAATAVPDYFDRQREVDAFESVALLRARGVTVGDAGSPERVLAMGVTPSFFGLLRVSPSGGRTFTEEEGQPGNQRRVLLSHPLWQQQYGGREGVIGTEIRVDGVAHTIVGIMPEGFLFRDRDVRLWLPLTFTDEQKSDDSRHSNNHEMIGRLKDGASVALAQEQVDALNRRNLERFPAFKEILTSAGFHTVVRGYRDELTRDIGGTLYLLQGGVLVVLLIGCVNIANLVLVRSTVRSRELATRFALGAGRWRMVRQLLTESMLLAVAGGVIGTGVGYAGLRMLTALGADRLPRAEEIGIHAPVLLATALLSLIAGALFGTIPVARLFGADLSSVFRQESRSGTASRTALFARSTLVVTQVSLAFALLIGAGLLLVSFSRKLSVDPGFEPENVVTASISLPTSRYPDSSPAAFYRNVLERIRGIPGVEVAGATTVIPFGDDFDASVISPEGHVSKPGESPLSSVNSTITPGYFEAMRIAVVRGRNFDARDNEGAAPVVIIDEWLANRYWPGQDAIGKRLFEGVPEMEEEPEYRTIVGVVKEIRAANLGGGTDQVGHYYFPHEQRPVGQLFIAVRAVRDPLALIAAVRAEVTALDPDLPIYAIHTMRDRIGESLLTDRARMMLIVIFAGVALLLATIGIYGVLAYSVALRTREIGIRVALGSRAPEIFKLVLGQGLRLLGVGLAIGLVGSLLLSRVLRGMLFGVGPNDPTVFAGVLALLGLVAVVACVIPARRATRIHPARALTIG